MRNIYDKDDGFRLFTLKEANAILTEVIDLTEMAITKLAELKRRFESQKEQTSASIDEAGFESESVEILENWAYEIVTLGAYPKGYFTVDFKSPVPDTLMCWTYGEEVIGHTHKIYETFKDRIPIDDMDTIGFEQSKN